jgi:hypothetical protein
MANTLTNLIPAAYAALDNVSRELVGLIPSVNRDMTSDRVAKGQTLYVPVAPANTASDFTPAATVTAASDQTISTQSVVIDNYRKSAFNLTGEEVYALDAGPGSGVLMRDMIEQSLRVLVNEIETSIFTAAKTGGSRAYGTAGTTPFDSTNKLAFTAQIKKILDDNGAPMMDRSLIIDTSAGAALRTLTQLTNVNESGSAMTLRDGELLNVHGFSIKESAQLASHTAGTGASYQLSAALAVGDTTVAVDTGSGTILAGDVVTISGYKYVVATALSGGSFTINAPGIRNVVADNTAITVNAAHTKNLGFSRNAMLLASRIPKSGNDSKTGSEIITDSRSGLSFEIATYPGYGMEIVEVRIAYGVKVIKPEHLAVLLG